jgi:hypothetical protein
MKIGVGSHIYKVNHLVWSQPCHRWETTQEIKLNYAQEFPIELELYYSTKSIP